MGYQQTATIAAPRDAAALRWATAAALASGEIRAFPGLPAPYRSEAFAEDLPEPSPVSHPRTQRGAAWLLVVPLGAALIGSALPVLNVIV
jgi:hypothetical protein